MKYRFHEDGAGLDGHDVKWIRHDMNTDIFRQCNYVYTVIIIKVSESRRTDRHYDKHTHVTRANRSERQKQTQNEIKRAEKKNIDK